MAICTASCCWGSSCGRGAKSDSSEIAGSPEPACVCWEIVRATSIQPRRLATWRPIVLHAHDMLDHRNLPQKLLESSQLLHDRAFRLLDQPEASNCLSYECTYQRPCCKHIPHAYAWVILLTFRISSCPFGSSTIPHATEKHFKTLSRCMKTKELHTGAASRPPPMRKRQQWYNAAIKP